MTFPESPLAHKHLDGLRGIEIGASAHNPFGLNTLNVDYRQHAPGDMWYEEQIKQCGRCAHVDVIADARYLPFADGEFDFVLSCHSLEHIFDPIAALKEWARVATKYIFIIIPKRDASPTDAVRPLTTLDELIARYNCEVPYDYTDNHHSIWEPATFLQLLEYLKFEVVEWQATDDKVGNGHTYVIKLNKQDQI